MRTTFSQIDKHIERWLLLIFYVMLVGTMFIEVLRRELLAYSSIWGEEIVRYSFIYLAWIGASSALKERAHIRIDVLFHYVNKKVKHLLYMLGDLVMMAVAVVAFYYSLETVLVSAKFGSVTHGLRISQVWFLSAVPIGFCLVIYRLFQSFIRDLKNFRSGATVFEGSKLFD